MWQRSQRVPIIYGLQIIIIVTQCTHTHMGERERKNGEEGGERNLYKSVLNFIAFEAVLQLAL